MSKIRIAILCPSEIAFRRFLPAVLKSDDFEYAGLGVPSKSEWYMDNKNNIELVDTEIIKAKKIVDSYGGKIFETYHALIKSPEVDAIYVPLPPALHYYWGKKVLLNNKHLYLEKPSTDSYEKTVELIDIAKEKNLAVHENYMFMFHNQIAQIKNMIDEGIIGNIRLFRIAFGFPFRGATDFRYSKNMGGGALLDCGGYTVKLARYLLGESANLMYKNLNYVNGFDVDMFGTAVLKNDKNIEAQLSFGMDNSYKCELEVWGQKGVIFTPRVFTAPDGFTVEIKTIINNEEKLTLVDPDDSFKKSIDNFYKCITNDEVRLFNYTEIIKQAQMIERIKD